MGQRILIVDDDRDLLHLIGMRLSASGYDVVEAESGEAALDLFRCQRPQLVITDLRMGGMDGMTLFTHLHAEAPLMPVIILTAHGTIPEAVEAMQRGVFSFLTKPFESQELLRRVADALRLAPSPHAGEEDAAWQSGLLTANARMHELLHLARQAALTKRATLLVGPDGSGKRVLAEAMHRAGPLAQGRFVTLTCTELTEDEIESALLREGSGNALHQAGGGVLYIRDIGAMPLRVQSRFFNFLLAQMQARDPLQRLQSSSAGARLPDLQVIAGTHRPLDAAVADGSFRSDLFYLLSGCSLMVPPLGERPDDIPLLARHFLSSIDPAASLPADSLQALQEARWPGNVEQLQTVVSQAQSLSQGRPISAMIVRRLIRETDEVALVAFDEARRAFERDYLIRLLQATAGNVSQAARVAQRNRTEFYKLLGRHGLDPVAFKEYAK